MIPTLKHSVFILIQVIILSCKAQSYDTLAAKEFIKEYFADIKKRERIFIVDSCVKHLFWPNQRNTIYAELKEYMTLEKLDTLFADALINANRFSWNTLEVDGIRIIKQGEAESLILEGSTYQWIYNPRKICKRKITITPDPNNVYWFSCPIFFNESYCLVYRGHTYGPMQGSSCVILYKKDLYHRWIIEKWVFCKIS
jgi:hypothetical protein